MKSYTGGCHCGHIQFEATIDIEEKRPVECDCSHCYMKGFVLAFIPASQFQLSLGGVETDPTAESPEGLTEYQFNKKWIHHLFCTTCGVQVYGHAVNPKDGAPTVAVNLRTARDLDLRDLDIQKFAGKDL